ncbi:MAG: hypothetical protein OWR62_16460 [Sulfobacillus thermotolerans]|uniref:UreE urease accessory N-terminal domain-containing protein n=1 Tax=Sulfobacillus thermotolerans TaxID=338644 RepID=A0ABN5H2K9_9FIRM|nr:hypothetical protein BXT84_13880 [Sulfobacillus thermotolerans]MCY0909967.1 hypothetical protein [Sulfobacillus thermotolerans]
MEPVSVTAVIGIYEENQTEKTIDWVDIDVELCDKLRWKKETEQGRLLLVDLPRFTTIGHHDVLYDDGHYQIVARMQPVAVWVMEPKTFEEMGTLCYHIGNLHQPCLVDGHTVLAPPEESLRALAHALKVSCRQEERILPRGFATRSRSGHRHAL